MQTKDYTLLIVNILTNDANREQCLAILECTDGDLRAHAQARLKVLDDVQNDAQKTIYTQTPPGMVDSWQLRDWWYENFGVVNICDIDFSAISDGKKQEYYAYANEFVENNL